MHQRDIISVDAVSDPAKTRKQLPDHIVPSISAAALLMHVMAFRLLGYPM